MDEITNWREWGLLGLLGGLFRAIREPNNFNTEKLLPKIIIVIIYCFLIFAIIYRHINVLKLLFT